MTTFDLYDLPVELREYVFKFCNVKDLINIACTSSTQYSSVAHLLWSNVAIPWEHIEDKSSISDRKVDYLRFTKSLRLYSSQDYHDCPLMDYCQNHPLTGVSLLSSTRFKRMDPLYTRQKEIVSMYKEILSYCDKEKLKEITFSWPFHINYMITLPCKIFKRSLRSLTLIDEYTVKGYWKDIGSLDLLETLNIDNCLMEDDDVKEIVRLKKLKELTLDWCEGMTEESVCYLTTLKSLRKIDLQNTVQYNVSADTLCMLKDLKNLRHLNLNYSAINDDTLNCLCTQLSQLETLSIAGCKEISDSGVLTICTKSSIVALNLCDTIITDKALSKMKNLKKLSYLNVRKTAITDDGLAHLQNIKSLETLYLCYTLVTSWGMEYLWESDSLKLMSIVGTSVCEEALVLLIMANPTIYDNNLRVYGLS